ncbi:MAG: UDP-N-acetylglucosamine 2-epimerase [Bacteroidota bacterium]
MNNRIAILTSSRADFGIYLPLLNRLRETQGISLELIVFGTHLSNEHGYTINEILKEGFTVNHQIYEAQKSDDKKGIAENFADYTKVFSTFWNKEQDSFDIVLALGDRYEMAAAVMASIPYGIKIGHLHAGETTLGAIDNIYRHCITLCASICFTSTEQYKERVLQIKDNIPVYTVGALSLEGIKTLDLPSKELLAQTFNIDFSRPVILVVFHPETVNPQNNKIYIQEVIKVMKANKDYSFVVNYPNMDTNASDIRSELNLYKASLNGDSRITFVEHFGKKNYFACMSYCALMLGNSSSGIIEAASFEKYVINIGDRQKGRAKSDNVIDCEIESASITNTISELIKKGAYKGENIYLPTAIPSDIIIQRISNYTIEKMA